MPISFELNLPLSLPILCPHFQSGDGRGGRGGREEEAAARVEEGAQLTQRVGNQVQRALVLAHDLAVQAGEVEPVEDVVLVDLGEVFLPSALLLMDISVWACLVQKGRTFPLVERNQLIHLLSATHRGCSRVGIVAVGARGEVVHGVLGDVPLESGCKIEDRVGGIVDSLVPATTVPENCQGDSPCQPKRHYRPLLHLVHPCKQPCRQQRARPVP